MTETITFTLTACFDAQHPETPGFYGFQTYMPTEEAARELATRFPKNCKIKGGRLGGHDTFTGFVQTSSGLTPNGSRGERNETAIARYRSIIRACDKLGIKIEYRARYSNSYPTREAFEAAAIN